MDCEKIGGLIARLRRERGMTQRQLAQCLQVSDKAVSKWERGLGCPDVSLLTDLARFLQVDISALLDGQLPPEDQTGGNMKKAKYYVCPACGNISVSTGMGQWSCCGRPVEALTPKKAEGDDRLRPERLEDEWFITSEHPMTKAHHISFVALASGDRLQLVRQYPEWELQVRFPAGVHGMLLWCCTEHGMFYQLI